MLIGLFVVNLEDSERNKHEVNREEPSKNRVSSNRDGANLSERQNSNREPKITKGITDRKSEQSEAEIYPAVDALVGNSNLSNDDSARGLIAIVAGNSASLGEKIEALSHAMLLTSDENFNSICELTKKQDFPVELADMVATELYNRPLHNQIEGSLILLDYLDSGVSGRAAELLSFVIEREDLQHQVNELRMEAMKKLKALSVDEVKTN